MNQSDAMTHLGKEAPIEGIHLDQALSTGVTPGQNSFTSIGIDDLLNSSSH
jgi:hypothetical protein